MLSLYKEGKTDAQVARSIGVSRRTITNWKGADAEFMRSIKESASIPDDLVEASLFSRATGYTHPEEKIFVHEGQVIRVKTLKHYPPDVTAAIFWLCNRQPDRFRRGDPPLPPQLPTVDVIAIGTGKRIYAEFCAKAGYPEPYKRQEEMRAFGFEIEDPRILLGARGYGKTDYVTILGTAYDIYMHGVNTSNLIISKSRTRNTALIQEIANALEANGVALEKNNSTCIRIVGLVGKDHSAEALTIKSSFRGRHPKRILMDDPVTEEDISEAMRLLVKRKYDEAYKLCKNICVIGQPAHAFDLYSELRPILKKLEVPWGEIPELDADLEAMRLAGVDSNSIEMSYHLRIPKDGQVPFAGLKFIDKFPTGDSIAFIDPSDGGDFSAISAIKAFMDGVAAVGSAYPRAWYHCIDEMIVFMKKHGVRKVYFETNATGTQPIVQLRELLVPHGIGVQGVHSDSNKEAIIMSAASYSHMIHLSRESNGAYTSQVTKYEPKAKNDDAPDSLARALERVGLIRGKK